jgi:hypothetical protein
LQVGSNLNVQVSRCRGSKIQKLPACISHQ